MLKVKDKEVLDKYNNPTIFQFFPATNTRILLVGKPRSENLGKGKIKEAKNTTKTTIPSPNYNFKADDAFSYSVNPIQYRHIQNRVRSEYWDAVAIMEYTDRAGFCRMVSQKLLFSFVILAKKYCAPGSE